MANTRAERWWFAGISLLVFIYVLRRAASVPLVHDEATSFLAYAQTRHFLPFASMWDANNHFFNSLLGCIGYKLFGLHLLALRWGSVLSFLLFAWSAWRIGTALGQRVVRWSFWLALLACPFLLDFFSLFRGYGPGMAFLIFSLQAVVRYAQVRRSKVLVLSLLSMAIANEFVLVLVPLWTVMMVLLLWYCRTDRRQLLIWVVLGVLPLAGAGGLALAMARFDLLYHGSTEGFVEVTIRTLTRYVLGTFSWPVVIGCVLLLATAVLTLFQRAWRDRLFTSPGFMLASLFAMEVFMRMVMANVFGINYAEDRSALHTLVLGILVLAFSMDALAAERRALQWAALLLLVLPMRSLINLNVDHTSLWPEQAIPDRFVHHVEVFERELGRPAVVGAYRLSGLTWSLQRRMLGGEGDVNAVGWPSGAHDVRIVDDRFQNEDMSGYALVDSAPSAGLRLLVREPRIATRPIADTSYYFSDDSATRHVLFSWEASALHEHDLFVEVAGSLASRYRPLDVRLCLAVFDTLGEPVHNDFVFLSTRRANWRGEAFHTIRLVPQRVDAGRIEVWLWNPERAFVSADSGRVLMHVVER